jgi:GxxExxY protein
MDIVQLDKLSNELIGYAINVHKKLGPGFMEKFYSMALTCEFEINNVGFVREKAIRVMYERVLLGEQRLDFLIENEIVLEIKAVYDLNNFHMAQTLSYLKASGKRLALILNFARAKLQIKRVVSNL